MPPHLAPAGPTLLFASALALSPSALACEVPSFASAERLRDRGDASLGPDRRAAAQQGL